MRLNLNQSHLTFIEGEWFVQVESVSVSLSAAQYAEMLPKCGGLWAHVVCVRVYLCMQMPLCFCVRVCVCNVCMLVQRA